MKYDFCRLVLQTLIENSESFVFDMRDGELRKELIALREMKGELNLRMNDIDSLRKRELDLIDKIIDEKKRVEREVVEVSREKFELDKMKSLLSAIRLDDINLDVQNRFAEIENCHEASKLYYKQRKPTLKERIFGSNFSRMIDSYEKKKLLKEEAEKEVRKMKREVEKLSQLLAFKRNNIPSLVALRNELDLNDLEWGKFEVEKIESKRNEIKAIENRVLKLISYHLDSNDLVKMIKIDTSVDYEKNLREILEKLILCEDDVVKSFNVTIYSDRMEKELRDLVSIKKRNIANED